MSGPSNCLSSMGPTSVSFCTLSSSYNSNSSWWRAQWTKGRWQGTYDADEKPLSSLSLIYCRHHMYRSTIKRSARPRHSHRHPSFGEETIDGWIPVSLPFNRCPKDLYKRRLKERHSGHSLQTIVWFSLSLSHPASPVLLLAGWDRDRENQLSTTHPSTLNLGIVNPPEYLSRWAGSRFHG